MSTNLRPIHPNDSWVMNESNKVVGVQTNNNSDKQIFPQYSLDPTTGAVTGLVGPDGTAEAWKRYARDPLFEFRQLHGLTNGRQASGTGDTMTVDTTVVRNGSSTVKLTLPTNGTYWGEISLPTTAHKFNTLRCGLMVYIPDYTKIGNITVYLAKESGYTNFVTCAYRIMDTGGSANRFNGWHYVQWPNAVTGWAAGGGSVIDGDSIAAIKFRVNPAGGTNSGVVNFDSFYQINKRSKPTILITADDNYDSWNEYGISYLNQLGLKHTHAVIGSVVGSAGYMTLAQLQAAYAQGHDFVAHGVAALNTYGTAKLQIEDVLSNSAWLASNGFTRRNGHKHYVYPNGVYETAAGNSQIIEVIKQAGMRSGRGVVKPTRIVTDVDMGDRTMIYHIIGGESTDTPVTLKSAIDACVANGETGVLMFHKIVTGTPSTSIEYNKADFEDVMNYIAALKNAGSVDVLTIPEWYEQQVSSGTFGTTYR